MNAELLSRIAETIYWTGRYVERADDTARLIDVYVHRMLGETGAGSDAACRALFGILGVPVEPGGELDIDVVLFRLVFEAASPSAIAGSMLGARAGARGIREVISSEMWECLNVTAHGLPGQKRAAERLGPHVYLRYIRERSALFFGLADSTMSHDDAWRFLVLGRSLERADMTARLLLARMSAPDDLGWPVLLRACGAHESFIRTHGWAAEPDKVAEFLLLDRLFPRSVVHALSHRGGVAGRAQPGRDAGRRRRPGAPAGRAAAQPPGVRRPQAAHGPAARAAFHLAGDLRAGERGDRQAVLPVPDAGRLGTGRLRVGWRLRIEHITEVRYAGPVLTSFNEARMTPLTLPSQITLESRVTAGPGVPVWTYNDYWGTFVSVFDLPEPHDDLVIRSAATVETEPFGGPAGDEDRPSWAAAPRARRRRPPA